MLGRFDSHCEKRQRIIVSKDKGKCQHIANNVNANMVSQYAIDKEVLPENVERCDWLLLNEDSKNAYYIELKGSDIPKAIHQIESTEKQLKDELIEYQSLYRIVYKSGSHNVRGSNVIKWIEKCGKTRDGEIKRAIVSQMKYEEKI